MYIYFLVLGPLFCMSKSRVAALLCVNDRGSSDYEAAASTTLVVAARLSKNTVTFRSSQKMDKELIMKQSPAALWQVRYTNYQACCPG